MAEEERFLPAQAPIDSVLDAGFRFADMSHQGSLIGLPGRTQAWSPTESAFSWTPAQFEPIIAAASDLDILVIGTGRDIAVLPAETEQVLKQAGLALEISATRAAVRTYNVLLSEDRRVAAALKALT